MRGCIHSIDIVKSTKKQDRSELTYVEELRGWPLQSTVNGELLGAEWKDFRGATHAWWPFYRHKNGFNQRKPQNVRSSLPAQCSTNLPQLSSRSPSQLSLSYFSHVAQASQMSGNRAERLTLRRRRQSSCQFEKTSTGDRVNEESIRRQKKSLMVTATWLQHLLRLK